MFHVHSDYIQKPLFGGRPNTKPGDHNTLNAHNRWFILLYHVWRRAWIEIHWNSIWLRARSHMISHHTWGVRDHTTWFWRCVETGRPLDTFFWALTIFVVMALLARVWSGPQSHVPNRWVLVSKMRTNTKCDSSLQRLHPVLVGCNPHSKSQNRDQIVRTLKWPKFRRCAMRNLGFG